MRPTTILFAASVASAAQSCDECHYLPSENATQENNPTANPASFPYDIDLLSNVPVADICNNANGTEELACARKYIDAIDEQLAFLYARRLGYAAVAGHSKFRSNSSLNDPSRNDVVAEGMAQRVLKYGGSEAAGRVMGGEGCQIFASLEFEVDNIQQVCDPSFDEKFDRVCT